MGRKIIWTTERKAVVRALLDAGMSRRDAATVSGVSRDTVDKEAAPKKDPQGGLKQATQTILDDFKPPVVAEGSRTEKFARTLEFSRRSLTGDGAAERGLLRAVSALQGVLEGDDPQSELRHLIDALNSLVPYVKGR